MRRTKPRPLSAVLLAACLIAAARPASAAEVELPIVPGARVMVGPYLVESWGHRAGLPQDTVTAIIEGAHGFLWMTTFGGLARFDGEGVRRFGGDLAQGRLTLRFTAMAPAREGGLWLGAEDGGVVRWHAGRFQRPSQPGPLATATVWALDVGPSGLLVGSDAGLHVLTEDGWSAPPPPPGGEGPVTAAAWGAAGTAWLGAGGTVQVMPASGARQIVAHAEPREPVRAVSPDADGAWVVVGGKIGFATRAGVRVASAAPRQYAWDLAKDHQGGLWVGGDRRLTHHPDRRALRDALEADGVPPPSDVYRAGLRDIRTVTVDRAGTIWLGTDGAGLMRLTPQPFERIGAGQGLANRDVRLLADDGAGGAWVVSGCTDLARVVGHDVRPVSADLPILDCARALAVDRRGFLWVGVADTALRLSPAGVDEQGRARWATVERVRADAPVRALAFDAEGDLWIGTQGAGALIWRDGVRRRLRVGDGLLGSAVTSILPAADGAVWLGHDGGSTRWEPSGVQRWGAAEGHPPGVVRALRLDHEGGLWIGTYGGGLGYLAGGRLRTLTRDAGLPDDVVSALLIDEADHVWMNGNAGLFAARRHDLVTALGRPGWRPPVVTFPTGEGNGIGQPSALRGADGRLWFATMDGVVRVDPSAARRDPVSPTPVIEAADLDGHPLALDGSSEVHPGPGELTVGFTVAELHRPELLRFEYRMAGGTWVPAGDQRTVRIHNLPPGRHRFEVRTVDGAGRPSDALGSLSFRLQPTWHQVPAVRLLLALALVALGGALGAARIVGLKRRARAMAEEIEQRKRAEVALVAEQEQRLQLQAQLDHARRLEAIGRLAGGVAHDFNNLLTVTTSYTQLLQMDLEPPPDSDTAEFLQGIADCTQKAAELTAQLLTFGRRQHLDRRTFDLGEVVTGLMPMLRRLVRADVSLELAPHEGPLAVCVDRGQVEQAVVNLVANAAAAMPSGGTIGLSLALARPEDAALRWPDLDFTAPVAQLSVRDTGEGIPPEVLPHIFEPFFTTRHAGAGTGLGLASVHGFVEQSGGQVRVHSTPGEGTRFDVFLPCAPAGDAAVGRGAKGPAAPAVTPDTIEVRGHVLLCDDAEAVRRSVGDLLASRGLRVSVAASGAEALAILDAQAGSIDALVTDVVMPGMPGPALAEAARRRVPQLPVLFITGYADRHDLSAHAAEGPTAVVLKPFDAGRLVGALRGLLVREGQGADDDARA